MSNAFHFCNAEQNLDTFNLHTQKKSLTLKVLWRLLSFWRGMTTLKPVILLYTSCNHSEQELSCRTEPTRRSSLESQILDFTYVNSILNFKLSAFRHSIPQFITIFWNRRTMMVLFRSPEQTDLHTHPSSPL